MRNCLLIVAISIGVCFVGCGVVFMIAMGKADKVPSTAGSTKRNAPAAPKFVGVGSEGRLRLPGSSDKVAVAVDARAFDAFTHASVIGDSHGIAELALAERVFLVPSGTRVLVLEREGLGRKRVRILDGQFTGRAGWVPTEWVVPK